MFIRECSALMKSACQLRSAALRSIANSSGKKVFESLTSLMGVGILAAILCVGLGSPLQAQTTQQFTGSVRDTSGAVIPNATVTVRSQSTQIAVTTQTTSTGDYTVPYLKPDLYTIVASAPNFKTEIKTGIQLVVDQTSTIDFQLNVGSATQTVTVDASNAQVELSKADRGEIIEGQRVEEMPLDGRNPLTLFQLSPGTHDFSNPIYQRPFDNTFNNLYANGSPQQPGVNIDGITTNTSGDNAAFVPSVDIVQAFKVVLNAYDASYGGAGGAAIDMALKSGGQNFHGDVYDYARRPWMDANGWQNDYNNMPKPSHKRDQFGFEADGPVTIPHLYKGGKKLFFVAQYEQMNEVQPSASGNIYSVPNPAWLKGDFSTATYFNTTTNQTEPLIIYDPLTPLQQVVDPHDGKTKLAHSPFPGNIIPQNRIDSVGSALASIYNLIPTNIQPGSGYAPWSNNYYNLQIEHDKWRNAVIKVDYRLSDADTLSFHWGGQARWSEANNLTGFPLTNPATMQGIGYQPKAQTGTAQWTHVFNSRLLFDLKTSLMSNANGTTWGLNFKNESATLGFAPSYYNQLSNNNRFPNVNASGLPGAQQYAPFTYGSMGYENLYHTLAFLPTITYIRGAHTIRAGLDLRFEQWDNPFGGNNDNYNFDTNFTNEFWNSPDAPGYSSGLSIASMLLGYPDSGTVYNNLHAFYSQHYVAPWLQDDWKLTRRLTLNLGVRWDFLTPPVERHNWMDGTFNPSVLNPVSAQIPAGTAALATATNLQGGMEFAGVNGQPRSAYHLNMLNVQPRIGFAYAITNSMSIRGGIGENYLDDQTTDSTMGFSSQTSYTNSLDNGVTPFTATTGQGLSNPIPTVIQPTGSSLGYLTGVGQSLGFTNQTFHIPPFWSYSVTYEVSLMKHDVLSVGYVGNRSPSQNVTDNINHVSAQWNAQCDIERGGNRQLCDSSVGQIANPFYQVAPFAGTGYYSSPTISKSTFTRQYPEFQDINENGATNTARSWYNSLQATLSHQMGKDLSLHASYTHAKAESAGQWLDNVNRIQSRQVSTTNDVVHSVTLSGVAYLPFGRNRELFSGVNRWVDEVINGWELSPLYVFYSGFAWRPSGNWEINGGSMGVNHTTLASDADHSFKRIRGATPCVGYKDTDTGLVIPSPAATAAGCTTIPYVTAPNGYAVQRNVIDFGVRQPAGNHFDMAVSKNFSLPAATKAHMPEDTSLQLRLDMLNAFNHPNWDEGYDGGSGDLDFGTIQKGPSGPTNAPRYLQLSAKINF